MINLDFDLPIARPGRYAEIRDLIEVTYNLVYDKFKKTFPFDIGSSFSILFLSFNLIVTSESTFDDIVRDVQR